MPGSPYRVTGVKPRAPRCPATGSLHGPVMLPQEVGRTRGELVGSYGQGLNIAEGLIAVRPARTQSSLLPVPLIDQTVPLEKPCLNTIFDWRKNMTTTNKVPTRESMHARDGAQRHCIARHTDYC